MSNVGYETSRRIIEELRRERDEWRVRCPQVLPVVVCSEEVTPYSRGFRAIAGMPPLPVLGRSKSVQEEIKFRIESSLLNFYIMRTVPAPASFRLCQLNLSLPETQGYLLFPYNRNLEMSFMPESHSVPELQHDTEIVVLKKDLYRSAEADVVVWHGCSRDGTILYVQGGGTI